MKKGTYNRESTYNRNLRVHGVHTSVTMVVEFHGVAVEI